MEDQIRIGVCGRAEGEPRQAGSGEAGLGCRGTVKRQFYSAATQSVEKPCILLDSRLGRGQGTVEEVQLTMGKEAEQREKVFMFLQL